MRLFLKISESRITKMGLSRLFWLLVIPDSLPSCSKFRCHFSSARRRSASS
jgi:hypothetical protein